MPSTAEAVITTAVDDTQLGLNEEEIALLRYHQHQAAAAQQQQGGGGSSSSRAASRASSQGRLLLDSSSLAALSRHLDRLLHQIQARVEHLSAQTATVTLQQYDRAGMLVDAADAEIQRFHDLMAQIDELEVDFDRIRHIRDIVRDYRHRVEALERDLEYAAPQPSSSSRHHRSSGHHHHSSSSSHRHGHSHRHAGSSSGHRHRH